MLTKRRRNAVGVYTKRTQVKSRNNLDVSFYAQNTAENINIEVSYTKN